VGPAAGRPADSGLSRTQTASFGKITPLRLPLRRAGRLSSALHGGPRRSDVESVSLRVAARTHLTEDADSDAAP